MHNKEQLTYRRIYGFWAPLSMMWVVMSLEMPVINSVIARLPLPKENLAIFGIVFSISLIIEGPIIQMLSAATALSTSYGNYKRLSSFVLVSVSVLTLIHLVCALPPVFSFIAVHLLRMDNSFIQPARITFLLMLPWTAAIGYRRMWQGVLIRDGRTYAVTAIMILRMSATTLVLFAGFFLTSMRGSYIAALSLSTGVLAGAVSAGMFASSTVGKMKLALRNDRSMVDSDHSGKTDRDIISWKGLAVFYAPLALTSFVTMANRPVLSAGIARGLMPLESLAAWPVIISFVFLFQSFPLSFQEAAITLMAGEKENRKLRKCVIHIGSAVVLLYLAAVLTPFGRVLFLGWISGLREDLVSITALPLLVLSLVSVASPVISWSRAVNIREGTTAVIAEAVGINLAVVFITITLLNAFFSMTGILAAALSYTAAICAEAIFLILRTGKKKPEGLSLK